VSQGLRVRAAHLVVDVTDLDRAAVFWSALLGLGVTGREAGYLDLGPLGAGGPVLSFQLVPEAKAVKNRVHLDLAVDPGAGGVVAAGYRAHALGATPVSELHNADSAPWQVWRDPDGNEFCLVTEAAADTIPRPASQGVGDAQSAGAR
jgi:catechol 2,3-dioxygenase-like lactoylglutathione lyase family enzyme